MLRCRREDFAGLKLPPKMGHATPSRKCCDLKLLSSARIEAISDVTILRDALDEVHSETATQNTLHRTRAQKAQNSKTNIFQLTISTGDYVMIRTHPKKDHKLQSIWCGPMCLVEANSHLVFVVKVIVNAKSVTVHTQSIFPYLIAEHITHASEKLEKQVGNFGKKCHLVESITGVRKWSRTYEVSIWWAGYDDSYDEIRKPLSNICVDSRGVLEEYLITASQHNLKRGIINLYF